MSDIYFRVKIDSVRSGMVADMGSERWQTLCVLASFMDENGESYPSQDLIADILQVSRETANRRIKKLIDYRWQGKSIVAKRKNRSGGGKYDHNVYVIDTSCGIEIF